MGCCSSRPEERFDLQGIEPTEWNIDGGIQATLTIQTNLENPQQSPYHPRFGQNLARGVSQQPDGTMTCEIPPVSYATTVEVSLWSPLGVRMPGTGRQFRYKDPSAGKVIQLALKTCFARLYGPGPPQTPLRDPRSTVTELQETDQIATAIIEFHGSNTDTNGLRLTRRPSRSSSAPEKEAKTNVEDIVVKSLSSFVWTSKHDLLAEHTEHEQTFLHICAIGDYRRLLEFLLDHGCGDPAKKNRRDYCGRTAVQLAHAMERSTIEGMLTWDLTRDKPPPDVRGSDESRQIAALSELADKWRELRMVLPVDGEIVWERQSSGRWRQTPAPRFRQNADRVKILMEYMEVKSASVGPMSSKASRSEENPYLSASHPRGAGRGRGPQEASTSGIHTSRAGSVPRPPPQAADVPEHRLPPTPESHHAPLPEPQRLGETKAVVPIAKIPLYKPNPKSPPASFSRPAKTEETPTPIQLTKPPVLERPLARFLSSSYVQAGDILRASRRVEWFSLQALHISRQAFHLVIRFNASVAPDGPTKEQLDEGLELDDTLEELEDKIDRLLTLSLDDAYKDEEDHVYDLNRLYQIFFTRRAFFLDERDYKTNRVFQRLAAIDHANILRALHLRELGAHQLKGATMTQPLEPRQQLVPKSLALGRSRDPYASTALEENTIPTLRDYPPANPRSSAAEPGSRIPYPQTAWIQSNHPTVKGALLETAIPSKGSGAPALAGSTTFGERGTAEKAVVNAQYQAMTSYTPFELLQPRVIPKGSEPSVTQGVPTSTPTRGYEMGQKKGAMVSQTTAPLSVPEISKERQIPQSIPRHSGDETTFKPNPALNVRAPQMSSSSKQPSGLGPPDSTTYRRLSPETTISGNSSPPVPTVDWAAGPARKSRAGKEKSTQSPPSVVPEELRSQSIPGNTGTGRDEKAPAPIGRGAEVTLTTPGDRQRQKGKERKVKVAVAE